MMMISTQTVCLCSPPLPQSGAYIKSPPVSLSSLRKQAGALKWSSAGIFPQGRSCYSTLAIKQGLPYSFGSPDDKVPAKDTPVRDGAGTKNVELVDPISPTKLVDDQLPSLLSLVVNGFPPFKMSKYVDKAENHLDQYIKRYRNVISFDSYLRAGLSAAAYGHPGVINLDRLVAISINYALFFLLDDLFFDSPNEFLLDQYGISRNACGSPQKIREYLDHLDAIFSQQVQPCNPAPIIETIMWEAGQYTLGLSNPEWFNYYVKCVVEHHHVGVASHIDIVEGHNLYLHNVESYAAMRDGNLGGKFVQLMVEFANDSYIPSILRTDPYLEKLTTATSIHLGFVNDVFSYHKESLLEQNPRNLITVLLECEGKPFVQTMHMAIDVVNSYAHVIMDLEVEAWSSTLQNHMQGIKELIAGNVYFCSMDYRYRHIDSIFPELRDTTSTWKILPLVKGPRL